jgi:phosphoglycolate phosphatase-like HAD superfamily hydrolase
MIPDPTPEFLVLDFDGVICNADEECQLVTWLARHPPASPLPIVSHLAATEPEFTARFRHIRGYARMLEHFAVAHHPDAQLIHNRADFTKAFESIPASQVVAFTQAASAARRQLRDRQPSCWAWLQPLHPGVARALNNAAVPVAVATARDSASARVVLDHHGLGGAVAEIAGDCRDKAALARGLCERHGIDPGDVAFADDSIDNVLAVAATGARAYWAMWGHHVPEDLATARQAGITRLDLGELAWLAGAG